MIEKIEKQAKTACLWFAFLHHMRFCSYYSVGLGVVQMVQTEEISEDLRRRVVRSVREYQEKMCHAAAQRPQAHKSFYQRMVEEQS